MPVPATQYAFLAADKLDIEQSLPHVPRLPGDIADIIHGYGYLRTRTPGIDLDGFIPRACACVGALWAGVCIPLRRLRGNQQQPPGPPGRAESRHLSLQRRR